MGNTDLLNEERLREFEKIKTNYKQLGDDYNQLENKYNTLEFKHNKLNSRYKELLTQPFTIQECHEKAMKLASMNDVRFKTIRNEKGSKVKEMFLYLKSTKYYVPYAQTYLQEWLTDDVRTYTPEVVNRIVYALQGKTMINRELFVQPDNMINLKNGVLNMETESLKDHSADHFFQGVLNAQYDETAICPIWDKAIKNMVYTEEDYLRIKKWFGCHLVRNVKDQKAHFLCGISGGGKSKILHVLKDILGEQYVTNFELQDILDPHSYALGRMYRKYANINFDMSTMPLKDIAIYKRIVSRDVIQARNIYGSPFEYIPDIKLTFACNKMAYIPENILETPEFQRRTMITLIKKGYEENERDDNIYDKYSIELQNGGILNWMLEGRKLYLEEGFKQQDIKNLWKNNMDMSHAPNIKEKSSVVHNTNDLKTEVCDEFLE